MAMRKTREIEEILTNAGAHPMVRTIILEMSERMRVQHQQIMGLAEMFDKMVDNYQDIVNKMGSLGMVLDKSGITDKIKKSMEEQDDDPDDTHNHSRGHRH